MTQTTKKTAIVIGATGGIGRAVALRLAKDGFSITAGYAGSASKAEEVVAAIKSNGGAAVALKADVNNASEVEQLFQKTLNTFGTVDVVAHTAGIMPLSKIAEGDLEVFDKVIPMILRGT